MFCPNCGTDVKGGVEYCPNCGAQLMSNQGQPQQNNIPRQKTIKKVKASDIAAAGTSIGGLIVLVALFLLFIGMGSLFSLGLVICGVGLAIGGTLSAILTILEENFTK